MVGVEQHVGPDDTGVRRVIVDITLGGRYNYLRTGEPYTVLGVEPHGIRIRWLDERGWEDVIPK
ncbi:hypothetical protein LCGC14_2534870, partial [marine sediment metagenome]